MKLSYLTVQLEKAVFFQHLSGLGANLGQIDDSKCIYKLHDSSRSGGTEFINIEKFV